MITDRPLMKEHIWLRMKAFLAFLYEKSKQSWSRIWMTLFMALTTIFMLGYLIYRQKDLLLNYDWNIHPGSLLLALILYSIALNLAATNWGWILNTLGKRIKIYHPSALLPCLQCKQTPSWNVLVYRRAKFVLSRSGYFLPVGNPCQRD